MTIAEILAEIQSRAESKQTIPGSRAYKCPLCQDTGWITSEHDGYTFSHECECVKARRAEALMKKSGLSDVIKEQTFDAFRDDTPVRKMVKDAAKKYLNDLLNAENRKPWFYIGGNPGSGKTHICTAICGELLKNNIGVVYMQWLDESRKLKAYVNEPDFENLVEKYIECPVLYIDDLFKQTYRPTLVINEADIRMAFTILNARYLQNKPTIISGEWELMQLIQADEGVFSRVYERCKGHTVKIPRDARNNFRLMGEE